MDHKIKKLSVIIVIIGVSLANTPIEKAETREMESDFNNYFGVNLLYAFAPGGGISFEGGFRIGNKFRNLSFPVRLSIWSVPHGEYKDDEGYDYPSIIRVNVGIRYFNGLKLQQGFFLSDNITFTHGKFDDPQSQTKGTFQSIGILFELDTDGY